MLVTHAVTYLPKVDLIITMRQGEVSAVGTYDDLLATNEEFKEFIQTQLTESVEDDNGMFDSCVVFTGF